MHFRILKMIATSGFLTALDLSAPTSISEAPPRTPMWELTAPPDTLAGLRGLLLREGEGKAGERREGEGGKEVEEGQGTMGIWEGKGRDARERGERKKERRERKGGEELRQFLPTPLVPCSIRVPGCRIGQHSGAYTGGNEDYGMQISVSVAGRLTFPRIQNVTVMCEIACPLSYAEVFSFAF